MLNNSPSTFKKELFKILLYTCGIALFLNFAVSLIREYYLGHELLEQSIRTATNILAHDLIKPLAFNDKKEAASQLKILHKQVDFLEANLYDKNGTFMISVGDSEILSTIPQAVIAQDFAIIYSYDKIEAWKSLSENNQIYGYLQIRMTRHFFSKQFLITIGTLLARAIASLLLSLLIGRTLVNKISKTLQHFVTVSKQISSQGFDKNRYTTLPNQEVQLQEFVLLSKSFDEMLRKIWAQDEFIREYNDALEKKFEERTRELTNERAKTIHSAQLAALGGMAAKIAHEINNPLTIVASVGVLLKRTMEATVIDREKVNKQLEYLDETTKRMAQIVASIRNLSRDASNDPHLKTCLATILRDVLTVSTHQLKMAEVELRVDLEAQEFKIEFMAQPVQLAQIFVNLTNNAIHAVHELSEKWISISAKTINNFLIIDFMDSGPGIAQEIQQKMFTPFFTTKAVGIGTGLGLSISTSIINRHGGTLEIVQDLPHTCFRISLPLTPSS